MIIDKTYITKWNKKNKSYYENLGYILSESNRNIEVNVFDLPKYSSIQVDVICDHCHTMYQKTYGCVQGKEKHFCRQTDECKKAFNKYLGERTKKAIFEKYGVENISQTKLWHEKVAKTNTERYGGIAPTCSQEVRDKVKATNLERWGVENVSQNPEIRQRITQTTLEHWGVENVCQSEIIKKKKLETLQKNYGVESNISQSPKIRKKINQGLLDRSHGTGVNTSRLQEYIWLKIGGELNYKFKRKRLDIAFPEDKICIEVDGRGHFAYYKMKNESEEQFFKNESKREELLYSNGWKIIRIVETKCKKPQKLENLFENIHKAYDLCINGKQKVIIDYDINKIIYDDIEEDL